MIPRMNIPAHELHETSPAADASGDSKAKSKD
jgi:hypothetical protein